MKERKPKVEIKKRSWSEWQRIDLVDTISTWYWYDDIVHATRIEPSITLQLYDGSEIYVYDVRLNGGQSLLEQWEGDCNGR